MNNRLFLFPLMNSVLFKKVTLPFHIFEPRYKQMINDAVAMQMPIGIIPYQLNDDYSSLVCVAGLPHVLSTYSDGRMDIYITGSMKCLITDFESEDPYKVCYFRLLKENIDFDESLWMELESLRILLERWASHFLTDSIQRESFSHTLSDAELLVNYCAVFLVDDMATKKDIMEASSLTDKIKILLHAIGPKEISLGPFMPTLKF